MADYRRRRSDLRLRCLPSRWIRLTAVLVAIGLRPAQAAEPLEPASALKDFRLPAGYRIELAAAEPEVVDPIAIAFDAMGRLWVVEMHDYPTLPVGKSPSSRIRILEDRDRDGRYESAETFADGLLFPTGLQLWGSGAFVTLAGEVAYFPDDDRDDRADRKETWYEGFATLNEQLRANHPTLAADGLIYVAGGLRGGQIKNHRRPGDPPLSINGRDFAFNPRTGECRAVSGNGQFGLVIDDFGRRFTCSNRNPLIQVMFEQRYLQRNPQLVPPSMVHDVAAAGIESRLYPRSRALTTSAQHAGQFTAACGIEIYSGDALPADARGSAFICEPTANLVHREAIESAGAAMTARRVEQKSEFLTATDPWFRPVNLCTGPDGALYVVDMYRAVIEHPEWMTEELRDRPDLRDGADRGRIYRIVAADSSHDVTAKGRARLPPSHALHQRSAARQEPRPPESRRHDVLRQGLEHPNSWQRNLAVRLILESNDPPLAALRSLATESRSPTARSLALALLQARGACTSEFVVKALEDSSPEVRERALCIAEQYCDEPSVVVAMLRLAQDPSPRVRYQAALSSMYLPSRQAISSLRAVARRDHADEWTCRAIALASRERAAELLLSLLPREDDSDRSVSADLSPGLLRELASAVAVVGGKKQVTAVLSELPRANERAARTILWAFATALESRGSNLSAAMTAVQQSSPQAYADLLRAFDSALAIVLNGQAGDRERIAASQLLAILPRPETLTPLLTLVCEQSSPPALKLAVLDALRRHADGEIAEQLIASLPEQLPSVRRGIVELLTSQPKWATELLAAAELDSTIADEIGPARRAMLVEHRDATVREAAQRLFGAAMQDRQEVVNRYQPALTLTGDPDRGRQVFLANCASCHRLNGEGTAVGPDIGDSSMKTSAQLLADVLDPNRAIDANYVSYTALTVDGLAHQGLIRSETDGGIVLVGADGKTVTVFRDELESLTSGKSLMPEGLEQQISPQQIADLLMYLKTWRHAEDLRDAAANIGGLSK